MDFCNTSVVDWEAWGALGTWVVGAAAFWVAHKANSISTQLRAAEAAREKAASVGMVTGLRLEATHLAFRLKSFGEALDSLATNFNSTTLDRAMASSALLERVSLTDDPSKAALRATLPEALGKKISFLYALAYTVRQSFEGTEKVLADLGGGKATAEGLKTISVTAQAFINTAARVSAIEREMAEFLGLTSEELI